MTREEEIDIAAKLYFAKIDDYKGLNDNCTLHVMEDTDIEEAFKAGVEWADNNLSQNVINLEKIWHTMEELPERNTDICVQWKYGDILSFYYENFFYDGMVEYADRIERWAYIKDLLPKGGEK